MDRWIGDPTRQTGGNVTEDEGEKVKSWLTFWFHGLSKESNRVTDAWEKRHTCVDAEN